MDTINPPLVSVGIITYNHERYIRQCLEGVMMQRVNFSFEVIIGEDCSTDNTKKIIQEFERRYPGIIKPIYHKKNVGGARNAYEFVYPQLKGRYIAICEGDDYWTDPYKLQKQVDFLEQNPENVLCFHRVNTVNDASEIIQEQQASEISLYSWKDILHISIPTLSVIFRNCIAQIPKEIFKVNSGDTFLFGMLSKYGGAADLGFVGASYRKHSGGAYTSKTVIEQYKQTIHTRKLMKLSPFFTREQKKEIKMEIIKRKKLYVKHFIKKSEVVNCFKIAFC